MIWLLYNVFETAFTSIKWKQLIKFSEFFLKIFSIEKGMLGPKWCFYRLVTPHNLTQCILERFLIALNIRLRVNITNYFLRYLSQISQIDKLQFLINKKQTREKIIFKIKLKATLVLGLWTVQNLSVKKSKLIWRNKPLRAQFFTSFESQNTNLPQFGKFFWGGINFR